MHVTSEQGINHRAQEDAHAYQDGCHGDGYNLTAIITPAGGPFLWIAFDELVEAFHVTPKTGAALIVERIPILPE